MISKPTDDHNSEYLWSRIKYLEEKYKELEQEKIFYRNMVERLNKRMIQILGMLPPDPKRFSTKKERIIYIVLALNAGEINSQWKNVTLAANVDQLAKWIVDYTSLEWIDQISKPEPIFFNNAKVCITEVLHFIYEIDDESVVNISLPKRISIATFKKFKNLAKDKNHSQLLDYLDIIISKISKS